MNAPPTTPVPSEKIAPDVAETDLARNLGVSRDDLKKMRASLVRGTHWHGGDGKPILITPAGVVALTALLDREKGAASALQEAASVAQSGSEYESLVIVRVGSSKVLFAKKPSPEKKDAPPSSSATAAPEPELLRVMVRSTLHFLPGMTLEKCRRSHQHDGVAYYHGRYPRRRGKY